MKEIIKTIKKIIHGNELTETNLKGEIQKRTLGEIADDYKRNRTILNTINNLHSKYNRKRTQKEHKKNINRT